MNRSTIILALVFLGGQCALAQSGYNLFQKGLIQERVKGDLDEAIKVYERIIVKFPNDRPIVAKAMLHIGLCYEKMGKQEAQKAYQRLIEEYADQHDTAAQARIRLAGMERDNGKPEVAVRKAWDSVRGVMGDSKFMAISPDGRYLSFCNLQNGNLAVRDLATGENRDITDDATWYGAQSHAIHTTWSPDGRQIACWWSGGGHSGLRIVNLDGSQARDLYNCADRPSGPWIYGCHDWSKDGKYILATLKRKADENKEVREIGLVSVADGLVRILKSPAVGLIEYPGMKISPDGRYIAYDRKVKEHEELRDIFLLSTDGSGKEVRLTEHPAADFSPVWAPDGKAIVFISNRDPGGIGLWIRYLVDGQPVGEAQLVKREAGKLYSLGFTKKGSLFYTTQTRWSHIYTASLDMETGKVLAPPKLLLRSGDFNMLPAWSRDGKSLAYASERVSLGEFGRRMVLVIRSAETGEERELLSKTYLGQLHWSPDGRSILYGAYWNPLRLIDVKTGHITEIKKTDPRILGRVWSPDGKTIYYIGQNVRNEVGDWPRRIVALDLETRQERELYTDGNPGKFLAISPDGRHLAFSKIVFLGGKRDEETSYGAWLKVIPTAGGEPRVLFNLRDQDLGLEENDWFVGPLAWTPDGRHLLFIRVNKSIGLPIIDSELWRIPVEGGKPQKLMEIESLLEFDIDTTPLSLHPDGQRIAFHKGEARQINLWEMENLLSKFKAGE
jgi:Tol biopolymer transport system component